MARTIPRQARWLITGTVISALSACGGGGGGGSAPPVAVTPPAPLKVDIAAPASADRDGSVSFTASGVTAGTTPTYAWTFGDGATSAEAAPRHTYAQAGVYEVSVSVTTSAGTTAQAKHSVAVNDRTHVRGLPCSATDGSGWCWQDPQPTGNRVQDFVFLDARTGWTAGWGGDFMKTADGGTTWTQVSSKQPMAIRHIALTDAQHVWGLTWTGSVLNTVDGGAIWGQSTPLRYEDYGGWLRVLSPSLVMAVQRYVGGAFSTDAGNTWTPMSFVPTLLDNRGRLWESRADGVAVSTDNGLTSRNVLGGQPNGFPMLYTAGANVHAEFTAPAAPGATMPGPVTTWVTTDGGATWTSFRATGIPDGWRTTRHFLDEQTGWVDTDDGVYRTTDGGRTWAWKGAPRFNTEEIFLDEGSTPTTTVRRLRNSQNGYFSRDAGDSWTSMQLPFPDHSFLLKHAGGTVWHALAGNGALKVSEDDMTSWRLIAGPQRSYKAFWFFDDRRGVALTDGGEPWTTADGGRSWQAPGPGVRMPVTVDGPVQMRFSGAQVGWALDERSQTLRLSVDGGANWDGTPLGDKKVVAATLISGRFGYAQVKEADGSHAIYAVGGASFVWERRGTAAYAFQRMAWLDELRGVGVTLNGQIEETSDGGKTWNTRRNDLAQGSLLNVIAAPDKSYWALSAGLPLRSTDGGLTWQVYTDTGTWRYFTAISFLDSRLGWASDSGGTMYATRDGGTTWKVQSKLASGGLRTLQFVNARVGWGVTPEGALIATGTGGD